jgi:hypothetical protein
VTLTTHPHLLPRSWMSRSYIPLPPSASMACGGTVLHQIGVCSGHLGCSCQGRPWLTPNSEEGQVRPHTCVTRKHTRVSSYAASEGLICRVLLMTKVKASSVFRPSPTGTTGWNEAWPHFRAVIRFWVLCSVSSPQTFRWTTYGSYSFEATKIPICFLRSWEAVPEKNNFLSF